MYNIGGSQYMTIAILLVVSCSHLSLYSYVSRKP